MMHIRNIPKQRGRGLSFQNRQQFHRLNNFHWRGLVIAHIAGQQVIRMHLERGDHLNRIFEIPIIEAAGLLRIFFQMVPVILEAQRKDAEAADHIERALAFSPSGEAIVEEWLDGPEVSANAFVLDEEVVFCAVSDRLVLEGFPGGLPRAHVLPSTAAGAAVGGIERLMGRVVAALGIRQGPVYAQLKLTAAGPRVIEVSPRLDGCHLWLLVRVVTGADLLAATAALLSGERPDLRPAVPGRAAVLTMLHRRPGEVFRRSDDAIPDGAWACGYHYREGEVVRPVNGFMETVGYHLAPVA